MYSESSTFPNFFIFTNFLILKYLLLISWHWVSNQKSFQGKISSNYIEFAKNQKRIGIISWSQKPYNGKVYFKHCFQLLKKNESGQIENKARLTGWKRRGKDISNTEYWYSWCWNNYTRSCIGNLFWQKLNHGAGTCELSCGVWHSNIQEEKEVCHNQKYSVNKPPYIQIRLFTAKENEVLKQVAYVKNTLNDFKELA